jgi:hypothetical protein
MKQLQHIQADVVRQFWVERKKDGFYQRVKH